MYEEDDGRGVAHAMTFNEQAHILIVDDEGYVRDSLRELLESWGHSVETADCCKAAVGKVQRRRFDIVIADLKLPDGGGMEVLRTARRRDEHCIVLIMTAFASVDTAVEALAEGAFEYFVKPLNFKHLNIILHRALMYRHLQLVAMESSLGDMQGIVGTSHGMNQVRAQIRAVAKTDMTVLILGETGTGKEVVARAIHDLSSRRNGPFVPVNCGALAESLLESELFGHVKGAFTGASSDKLGLFEAAQGGTIFLDEIESASPHTQVALLRVLDYNELRPVGATTGKHIDARVLIASNKDLESLVATGEFREDLFYRLISSTITLPPLRDRVEDIPALVNWFVKEIGTKYGKSNRRFSPKAIELMMRHPWRGNVRELKHVVQRAIMSSQKTIIRPADLPDFLKRPLAGQFLPTLDEVERRHIEKALRICNWNKSEAARLIGVRRERLYSLIEKHGFPLSGNA